MVSPSPPHVLGVPLPCTAAGITGQLLLPKITAFERTYTRAKASLAATSRPTAASEVQMVDLFAFRDAEIRAEDGRVTYAFPLPGGIEPRGYQLCFC